ncbi:hypothetical protein OIU85_004164 [Salix viminalis]|uniref:Uncharacterized protein n=1 Tax=Salix viminalis TaxID=40686 RepID=A0A9Q0PSR2_SALVM|nr:hypothetical protein OIU85_004164 [Salix viminalis]
MAALVLQRGCGIDFPSVHAEKKKMNKMKTVSAKREIDSPLSKSDVFPKQDASLKTEGSRCTYEALFDYNSKDTICIKGLDLGKKGTEGAGSNHITKNLEEAFSSIDLSEYNSCKTMDIKSYGKGCGSECTKYGCQCFNADNVDVMVKSDAANHGYHRQIWRAKKNSPLNWQKRQRLFREGKLHWESRLDCANVKEHTSLRERSFHSQQNTFADKGLLPTPVVSSAGHGNAACVSNRMSNAERKMHRGFHRKVFFRHDWVPKHRLNGNHSQYFSRSNQAPEIECNKSRLLSHCAFGYDRNHSRGIGWGGYGQTFSRPISTHGSYCLNPSSAANAHAQQKFTRLIHRMNHVTGRCSDNSVDGKLHSRLIYYNQYRERHVIPCGAKAMWVPVCTKDSVMPENTYPASACNSYDILQFSCNELPDSHSKGYVVPSCVSSSLNDSKSSSLTSSHRKNSVEGEAPKSEEFSVEAHKAESAKDDMACTEKSRDVSQFFGSQVRTEESHVARKLQLEYQSTLGHPIAEFERFLHSAAPVITSSCTYKNERLNISLHLTQIPFTSLQAVWQWYEMPGNYGLEVKARDSQSINGLLTGSTSFCAYFVPFLSAVQLYGYPHLSDACPKDLHTNPELIFEFFESEMPHFRKPLHLKIRDLISIGTSNLQVFGDPSKLESMNLHDLHPATWFSVAWYPIYRIPGGKFSASFLTYHLLGQSVMQTIPIDSLSKMFQIVFPVIGLRSYNTQGECWFDLRTPAEPSSKETIKARTAAILSERRRALEENASLLSRGTVANDKAKGVNQHPDYKFFISRKS